MDAIFAMNKHAGTPPGAISQVKGEVLSPLAEALAALNAYAADSQDPASLALARGKLHEAQAALSMIREEALARFTQELEALVSGLEAEASPHEHLATAVQAVEALSSYLAGSVSPRGNWPLTLLPIYARLLDALGKGPADPVDLFFPDLSFHPPLRQNNALSGDGQEVREQRANFQRGLLNWLRGEAHGAAEMRGAVEAIEAAQDSQGQRPFWWVTLAFFHALERNALASDLDVKRTCNRIEQQLRRLAGGSDAVPERLFREVLYCVGRARPEDEHVQAVQHVCGLNHSLAAEETAPGFDPATLNDAREALVRASEAWTQCVSAQGRSPSDFQRSAGALRERAARLGNADLSALIDEVSRLGV